MVPNPIMTGRVSFDELIDVSCGLLAKNTTFSLPKSGTPIAYGKSEKEGYDFMVLLPGLSGITQWSFRLRDPMNVLPPVCVFFDILPTNSGQSAAFFRFVEEETYEADLRGEYFDTNFLMAFIECLGDEYKISKQADNRNSKGSAQFTRSSANRATRRKNARANKGKGAARA